MKYLKHYWICINTGTYSCENNPVEKRHPEVEFPGLDVRIWMHDQDGIDVCLSRVPDDVTITEIVNPNNGKKIVQELTEAEFNSVHLPLEEYASISEEAKIAETSGDKEIAEAKSAEASAKYEEARQALFAL